MAPLLAVLLLAAAGARAEEGALATAQELRPIVAVAGDATAQANDSLRALNDGMRANYAATLERVSNRIDPVLVVQFDGVGGTFNLRDGGRMTRVQPVPVGYDLSKSVAHVPLDLYVIVAPYLEAPAGGAWQGALAASGERIRAALALLEDSELTASARGDARTVLEASLAFVEEALARGDFSEEGYKAYSRAVFEAVGRLRAYATEIQIEAVVGLLERWRDEMGPERWRELSAVVIAPFTLSGENAVAQILRRMMDPERVERRLIVIGGDYGRDVDVAVSVFGRLYLDGLAARLIFAQDTALGEEMTQSLSTARDLMAVPAAETLERVLGEGR